MSISVPPLEEQAQARWQFSHAPLEVGEVLLGVGFGLGAIQARLGIGVDQLIERVVMQPMDTPARIEFL